MYIFLYGRCGHRPLQLSIERTSSEFHTPNIQRAQTERLHGMPCDWEARSGGRPKGVPYGTRYRRMVRRSKMLFQARKRYFASKRSFLPYLFCHDRKDMARGAADAASQIAPRLRRIRTAPPEASHAIRRKKTPPSRGFFYAQSYPHVDVDCLQIFCSQLRNRCFTKLPVDRSDFRAHLPVDK